MSWDQIAHSVITWIVILGVLVFYELLTALDKNPITVPLTGVVTRYVPGIITILFLLWLLIHFLIRYMKSEFWWWS